MLLWATGIAVGIVVGLAVGATAAVLWLRRRTGSTPAAEAGRERLAELSLLTGGLAHEIKNPLSTLQLNLQLLREDLEARAAGERPGEDRRGRASTDRMIRRVTSVHKEAGRLREILDDFLRYAGRLDLDARPTDLAAAFEELLDFLAPQAQRARVTLRGDWPPDLPRAEADGKLVKQAVLNLLLNAIQHTGEGGRVTLSLAATGSCVRVSVTDTGRGIASDERGRVFEPYYSRRKGGTGLGLPLTRRIVEAHGGTIQLDSEPGRGSTFSFDLPAAPNQVAAEQRAAVGSGRPTAGRWSAATLESVAQPDADLAAKGV